MQWLWLLYVKRSLAACLKKHERAVYTEDSNMSALAEHARLLDMVKCHSAWLVPVLLSTVISTTNSNPSTENLAPSYLFTKSSPIPMGDHAGPPTPVWFLPYHLSDFTFYYNITGLPTLTDLPWVSRPHKLISWVARFLWEHLLMSFYMDVSAFRSIRHNLEMRLGVADSRSMNSAKWAVSCY